MLRINFRSLQGDAPTVMKAMCMRFCADGTLRGPDNYVVARVLDGAWQVSGRPHRDLDCEGPLRVRLLTGLRSEPKLLGPFRHLRMVGGLLYGDDTCLNIRIPGMPGEGECHQLILVYEGGLNAKT